MHIISRRRLREFWQLHPKAESPLLAWYKVAKKAQWEKFADVRMVFPSADRVGRCIVFNTGGNRYRLITIILPGWKRVLVRHVLNHAEYDKGAWKRDCGC